VISSEPPWDRTGIERGSAIINSKNSLLVMNPPVSPGTRRPAALSPEPAGGRRSQGILVHLRLPHLLPAVDHVIFPKKYQTLTLGAYNRLEQ
jgi:hypothetical protein